MALVKCSNCGKKVSDTTNECIHCKTKIIKVNRCIECNNEMFKDYVCDNCGYEDLDKKTDNACRIIIKSSRVIRLLSFVFAILIIIGTFFSPNTWFVHLFAGLFMLGIAFVIKYFINWPAYVLKNLKKIRNQQK